MHASTFLQLLHSVNASQVWVWHVAGCNATWLSSLLTLQLLPASIASMHQETARPCTPNRSQVSDRVTVNGREELPQSPHVVCKYLLKFVLRLSFLFVLALHHHSCSSSSSSTKLMTDIQWAGLCFSLASCIPIRMPDWTPCF